MTHTNWFVSGTIHELITMNPWDRLSGTTLLRQTSTNSSSCPRLIVYIRSWIVMRFLPTSKRPAGVASAARRDVADEMAHSIPGYRPRTPSPRGKARAARTARQVRPLAHTHDRRHVSRRGPGDGVRKRRRERPFAWRRDAPR